MSDIPDFWRRPFRLIQYELRASDGRGLDARRIVAQALEHCASVLLVNAGGIMAWYPTRLPYHPPNESLRGDFLGTVLQEAHRQGLKVLVRLDLSKTRVAYRAEHPEWFRVPASAESAGDAEARGGQALALTCVNSPYWQEHGLRLLEEVITSYAVDGVYFAGYRYDHCTCALCRQTFREQTGQELPMAEDWDDPAFRAFVRTRYRQMAAYTRRLRGVIHERAAHVILAVDMALAGDVAEEVARAGWSGPSLAEQLDLLTLQASERAGRGEGMPMAVYGHRAGEEARLGRALPGGKPVSVFLSYAAWPTARRAARPAARLAHELMQVAAHGGQPCVVLSGTLDQDDRGALSAISTTYRYLRDHAASYEDLRSAARVALLYSQTTMDYYGRAAPGERALGEYRGFYQALVEAHVQFDVLHDAALKSEALARYELLILPNVGALSEAQRALLDTYVERGGHILASYETALYDGEGRPLPAGAVPALRCLGRRALERRALPGPYLRLHKKGLLGGFEDTALLPLDGVLWSTEPLDADAPQVTDLTLIPPLQSDEAELAFWEQESDIPGLILTAFGRGEAAYLPWQIGDLYYRYGAPGYRQLILDLVGRWSSPVATTDAPGAVELTVYHPRSERGRALVHLLNGAGAQGRPLTEVVPLAEVSVWIHGDYRAARELVHGQDLPLLREGHGVRFTIARLGSYAAVELVAEGHSLEEQEG